MSQIDRMRVFLRVAELSSFTAAAASLGLPKASVSTAVQQLETELGARLLHRTTRRVTLTHDGQVFFDRARELLGELDELTGSFQGEGAPLRGRLRVDMPIATARDVIIPRLPEFLGQHPGLTIELSSTDRFVDIVREGFDCVMRVGVRGDSSLIARTLGHYRQINCVSRGYLEQYGSLQSLESLSEHRLVHYVSTFGNAVDGFEYVDPRSGEARSIAMRGLITVNNSSAYLAACLAGLGIVQIPVVAVRAPLERGELVEVLPEFCPAPMPVALLYPNRHLPRRTRVFMDWMAALLRPHMLESDR
jgi:DNA-binding transcriptional LysR family regulator